MVISSLTAVFHFKFAMLRIRGSFIRSTAALVSPAARVSTRPQQDDQTFYEFRTYNIRPDQTAAFLKLTNEKIHLRTAHSQLIGYWNVEFGGLNQVFHIWKYGKVRLFFFCGCGSSSSLTVPPTSDSYSQRAAVRAALAQDPCWISEYISKAIPMLNSQDNEVNYMVPWTQLQSPLQEGGVYELVSYQMRPGGPVVWGDTFQASVTARAVPGYGKLLGVFHNEIGQLNRVHVLWWFQDADHRAELRRLSHSDARVVAAVRNSFGHLDSQRNILMFPCPFSPMK
ncbi:protein NipSnap homolog 3A isoform X1 [Echeneis naucrates]|uniref:protein NipSnap homolog 3A isoform X1 n=1 Tax=Echeneis naucrates TaxID=173247 RepID=UPI0011139E8B|nr:protein NipSnap homolog 3A-like isoform X1 [Echeneis naucrates]